VGSALRPGSGARPSSGDAALTGEGFGLGPVEAEPTMQQYHDALEEIIEHGTDRPNRTGVDTRALFGMQMRYRMSEGFPAITSKRLAFETMKAELLCFIRGASNVREFQAMGCHIWDENANAPYWKPKAREEGDLGRIYGVQWRHWRRPDGSEVDQLADVIERIKRAPSDRRLIVAAWNPGELDEMALPPCHALFQFFVADGKLSLQLYQRSADMFLGVPFNIASYSLLLHMVAQVTDLTPHEFIHTLGDAHIYHSHFDAVREQLSRPLLALPQLWLNPAIRAIDGFEMEDIKLHNYICAPAIKAPMAV
jgi:thymidylate synthase